MFVKLKLLLISCMTCLLLSGCDWWWSEPTPFIPYPAQLNPENDAFASALTRNYTFKEGWKVGSKDTTVMSRTFRAQKTKDTVLNGASFLKATFSATDGNALPGFVVTHLGFNPSKLLLDSAVIPDPGPALGFPVTPVAGWRSEQTNGDLRFVRTLTGFDTLSRPEGSVEAWAFAESTYWDGTAIATAKYSVGRNGLLRLYAQRLNFTPGNSNTASILWSEVTAQ